MSKLVEIHEDLSYQKLVSLLKATGFYDKDGLQYFLKDKEEYHFYELHIRRPVIHKGVLYVGTIVEILGGYNE